MGKLGITAVDYAPEQKNASNSGFPAFKSVSLGRTIMVDDGPEFR